MSELRTQKYQRLEIILVFIVAAAALPWNYSNTTLVKQLCGEMFMGDNWTYGYVAELADKCMTDFCSNTTYSTKWTLNELKQFTASCD